MKLILLLIAVMGLSACASSPAPQREEPLLPFAYEFRDPDDGALKAAIDTFLSNTEAPNFSQYKFVRSDLNGDGRRDALVMLETPYGYWCGTHGCTMLVMQAHNNHFELLNSVQPVRAPVYVSEASSNGWKDLVVRVSGRWQSAKDVALRFDGTKYPTNPDSLNHEPQIASLTKTQLFSF